MRGECDAVERADGVEHGTHGALCDCAGVELFECSRRGVACVWEGFFACGLERGVHGLKFLHRHVGLAADFDQRGRICHIESQRDRFHGAKICRDVIARRAVAARDAEREQAVAVVNGNRDAVHFRLHHVADFLRAELFADGLIEAEKFLDGALVLQAHAF